MNRLLIKSVELNGSTTDILIEGERIRQIAPNIIDDGAIQIDGRAKAAIPGFINTHTHAAMTLFRGCGDDMPLMRWLEEQIWPREAHLTEEDVYWGAKLACLEMIKSGTTCFIDSYHHQPATARAVEEMGIRGILASACFDNFDDAKAQKVRQSLPKLHNNTLQYSSRITYAIAPHAIYTVSPSTLQWIDAYAKANNLIIHLHLAETEGEVADSLQRFGFTPVRHLHHLGILSPRLLIAHGLYIDDEEIHILADHGVQVAHNPASNMKLASGHAFRFVEMRRAGIPVGIGTDGCSSSNNLDMVEAMKLASLLGKSWRKDPEVFTAAEAFYAATAQGADILHVDAGRIEEGRLADICLIDLNIPAFTPNLNFISNLVYAANGSCVDTLICNGRILMQGRKVAGEDEIMQQATRCAKRLC
ncbi:MAG: amidohydrolase [Tannerellaceae bacterium]|jgi:5-methylthioadenosine/S-adenosylhomocysteine deaminase|nr:amidohydrolase [Tannerellaceae bacterium]